MNCGSAGLKIPHHLRKQRPCFYWCKLSFMYIKCDCNNKNMTSKRHAEWDFNPAEPQLALAAGVATFKLSTQHGAHQQMSTE